jgi:hypothetical protein
MPFLKKWKDKFPKQILEEGKPFNMKTKAKTRKKPAKEA